MRPCFDESEFINLYNQASQEAIACFGNGDCYLEKLVLNPHHVEFQVIADTHGNAIQLGERDCSIQRRNQKVIEECPSPVMTPSLRRASWSLELGACVMCIWHPARSGTRSRQT